jgi:molybdopterin-guanine dinucleotide biosynthesis protein A
MQTIGVILAGGKSSRMGGRDKAEFEFAGRRLVDHVFERLARQVDVVLISGASSYGLAAVAVSDLDCGVYGPAAGVFSIANHIAERRAGFSSFLTVPVDGPFLPEDFAARMAGEGAAVAADRMRVHPTFASWPVAPTATMRDDATRAGKLSLHALADLLRARSVVWSDPRCFANINSPEDVAKWARWSCGPA